MLTVVACFTLAAAVAVASPGNRGAHANHNGLKAYVEDSLLAAVQQNPNQSFSVIVQGAQNQRTSGFVSKLLNSGSGTASVGFGQGNIRRQFTAINGFQGNLTGSQILFLARTGLASSIMANETVQPQAVQLPLYNMQLWPWSVGAPVDWLGSTPNAPTIAIVDSGIDPAHTADFGNRVLGQINMASLAPTQTGDPYGHGTFVAGIAAGAAPGYAGAAPKANLLSIDVMDSQGEATVGDVINACDWILANKSTYNIKVANFSLHAMNRASVLFDPLDQAVEKLWLNGVTVVAAAGNYATNAGTTPSGVEFAPGNDPFVITVGATDLGSSLGVSDDSVAPWSAWGYTPDGFMKPDLGAPGRYMVGPVTAGGVLTQEKPGNVVSPGYMQLSGTSFSAPVVSAAAAMLLAQHPTWTPDQVKGALMVTAIPETNVISGALGVGEVNIALARLYNGTPPNPNAALDQYLTTAPDGTVSFNASAWQQSALANPAWDTAAWSDAAWSSAAWSSAAWSSAAWSDAAWASAAWGSAAWSDAAWSDAAWSDAAWSDGAEQETASTDPPVVDSTTASTDEASLGIVDPTCDPTVSVCDAVDSTTTTTP